MYSRLGYSKPLFILAFDQRSSFTKEMFGLSGHPLPEKVKEIAWYKDLIYAGFERGLVMGIPVEYAAILCDEQFGDRILRDAFKKNYTFLLATEKSGQDELDFEYGHTFDAHIEKYKPTFVKVLVRYNPEADKEVSARQCKKLKVLSDYSHNSDYKFLIEALIPPTPEQLTAVNQDQKRFDLELRPHLAGQMIAQIQGAGVDPDVWKIEGLEKPEEYQAVVSQARANGRDEVGVVVLGRHAPDEQIEKWLVAGAKVPGVLGFAIGRTIFFDPLAAVMKKTLTPAQAIETMAQKYVYFYKVFTEAKVKSA